MIHEVLELLTWEDIQEIWFITERTLQSIPEDPEQWPEWACATSSRFGEALNRIRQENNLQPQVANRYTVLVAVAEHVTGCKLTESRAARNSLIRAIVAYQLVKDGYHYVEIGNVMQRDHSTVSHYVKKVENMLSLPRVFKRELAVFDEFQRRL